MLDMALRDFEPGDMAFVYMSDLDLQCHMLWRHGDPKYAGAPPHPAYEAESARRHHLDIERLYMGVDDALAEVRQRLPEDTLLLVMSDHGFEPEIRKFHLNAWLRDAGYLVLKDGKQEGHIVKDDVDWSHTVAYGMGFNGLYLNLQGREAQGIVKPEEAGDLLRAIRRGLEGYSDPETGDSVIREVYESSVAYSGTRVPEAPDLIVGYDHGYACSDESTLGEITAAVVEDNTSRWSGNHLGDPSITPGVLLVNRKNLHPGNDLTDIPVAILSHFGLQPAPGMVGETIFKD